ncbi:MAG: hypothetical protein CVV24_04710 [Ignavibacteriae bacterium HGW-Ignavibacteriae-3]|nr:MAG: hypothetical protein CVV24_04710 [Ignavibacteriae bacterium HGW-Ignavibacteriae-3]
MIFFLDSLLFSYGQIFFSNRRWFGALILIATFVTPEIGLMSLLGAVISNFTALVLKYDKAKIRSGFYGFNGILFGAAVLYFYKLSFPLLLLVLLFVVIVFLLASVLENYFATAFNLPGLSIPFVLGLYVFMIFLTNYDFITASSIKSYDNYFSFVPLWLQNYFKSLALILFQPSFLTGILISAGLLFFSRTLFLLSIAAFACNSLFLNFILPQHSDSLIIITGFNSILTSFALGGSLIIPSRKSFLLAIFSIVLVIVFTGFFYKVLPGNLPVLVLPFNFIVLFTLYSLRFRQEQSNLVALYFTPGTPEENYYYHHNRQSRFERFKIFSPELPFFGEWSVSQGYEGEHTHKDGWKYALDFVIADEDGKEFKEKGNEPTDYYCYSLPVSAPLDGEVVKTTEGIVDNKIGEVNLEKNWGNTIILKHGDAFYSSISHLMESGVKIKVGDFVKKGTILGQCGNSGRSPYPHIHFQFQASDKLGDITLQYPFAYFLQKTEHGLELKIFDVPKEGKSVRNIETHKSIKNAFNFSLGEKLKFECRLNAKTFIEGWEVKVDLFNSMYLESDSGGIAFFYQTDKLFYFTSYTGKRNCALYYFYLAAHQVPYCYHKNIYWSDRYSIVDLPGTNIRFITELFLLYKNFLTAEGNFSFGERFEDQDLFQIRNKIIFKGLGLFKLFSKSFDTCIDIGIDGDIHKIEFSEKGTIIFEAEILIK